MYNIYYLFKNNLFFTQTILPSWVFFAIFNLKFHSNIFMESTFKNNLILTVAKSQHFSLLRKVLRKTSQNAIRYHLRMNSISVCRRCTLSNSTFMNDTHWHAHSAYPLIIKVSTLRHIRLELSQLPFRIFKNKMTFHLPFWNIY